MKYSRISTLKFPGGPGMGLGKMGLMFRARGLRVLTPVSTEGGGEGSELGEGGD